MMDIDNNRRTSDVGGGTAKGTVLLLFAATLSSACFDDDGQSDGGEVFEQQAPALGAYSSMADLLPHQAVGQRFVVLTDSDVDVGYVAALAERFEEWSADWLGVPLQLDVERPFPIYLCDSIETIYEIERRSGWRTSNHLGRTFEFRGGFYETPGFIALPVRRFGDLDVVVIHELTHWVLSRIVQDAPDLIDEGLAEFLPELFRAAVGAPQPSAAFTEAHHQARCERAFKAGNVQPLEHLFDLGYWEFRDDQLTGRNYSLGWHLVRFLNESDHDQVVGRFPDFLVSLAMGASGWRAFRSAYDEALVERLWHAELQRPMAWEAAFGPWQAVTGGFKASITSTGSSVLLHDRRPTTEEAWELSFDFPGEANWPPGAVLGFAIAYRSDQDFRFLSIHGEHQEVVYSHFLEGEWRDVIRRPLAPGALPAGRLTLAIERDGSLRVRLNGKRLASLPAAPDIHGGRSGLMLELPALVPEQVEGEFTFHDVRLSEGRPPQSKPRVR